MPEFKELKFRKKAFGCIKQTFLQIIINKLAYETYENDPDRRSQSYDRDRDRRSFFK